MTPEIFRFIKRLILLTVGIAVVMGVVFWFFLKTWYIAVLPFLLLFFFGFTILTFSFMAKANEKGFGNFVRARMIVTVFRLLVYILITVLYVAFIKKGTVCFVVVLGLLYLIYTTFEVYQLSKLQPVVNQNKNKPSQNN